MFPLQQIMELDRQSMKHLRVFLHGNSFTKRNEFRLFFIRHG